MTWLKPKESWLTIGHEGTKIWKNKEGQCHRENGPAVINNDGTYKVWYLNGKFHREDGPAVIYTTGIKEYWLNDRCFSESEWKKRLGK